MSHPGLASWTIRLRHHVRRLQQLALAPALLLLTACGLGDDGCDAFRQPGSEIWLALGQSNAANGAATRSIGDAGVMSFDGRRCRAAADPLPGASGTGGTIWTPLANRWVSEGRAPRVLIVVRAQGSTRVSEWAPGGRLAWRIEHAVSALAARGLKPTRVFWYQGETEVILGHEPRDYARSLSALIADLRRRGVDAPVQVALVGRCGPHRDTAIRMGQTMAAAMQANVRLGPDMDRIGPDARHELCHLAAPGLARAVAMWHAALLARR